MSIGRLSMGKLSIGKLRLKNNIILAPMSGYTDTAFRILCKRYGCGLVFTEFVSADALLKSKVHRKRFELRSEERPAAVQLFGREEEKMLEAAKIAEKRCDIIDLNCGCPAPKIVHAGFGSALMGHPEKIGSIIALLAENLNIPVTAKIRSGVADKKINAPEVAKIIEENGASAIIVHPRTAEQGYSQRPDLSVITKIKKSAMIPIIGNGDITDEKSAEGMLKTTNCDGIMIGRAALGDPQIFERISHYLENKETIEKTGRREQFFEYYKLWKRHMLDFKALKLQSFNFTKGIKGGAKIRENISRVKDCSSLLELFK